MLHGACMGTHRAIWHVGACLVRTPESYETKRNMTWKPGFIEIA